MIRMIMFGVLLLMMVAAVGGAWQVAYGRGKDDGRAELAASRDAFIAGRPGGAVVKIGPSAGTKDGPSEVPVQPVDGTIEKVEGQTVTVKTSAGSVKVNLRGETEVRRQVKADAASLKPGDKVLVLGQKQGNDEVTADAIDIQS